MRAAGAGRWKSLGDVVLARRFAGDAYREPWGHNAAPVRNGSGVGGGAEGAFAAAFARHGDGEQGAQHPAAGDQYTGVQGSPFGAGNVRQGGAGYGFQYAGAASQEPGAGRQGDGGQGGLDYRANNLRQGEGRGFSYDACSQLNGTQNPGTTGGAQGPHLGGRQGDSGYDFPNTGSGMPLHPGAGRQSVHMPGAQFGAGNVRKADAGQGFPQFPDGSAVGSQLPQQGNGSYVHPQSDGGQLSRFRGPSDDKQYESAQWPQLQYSRQEEPGEGPPYSTPVSRPSDAQVGQANQQFNQGIAGVGSSQRTSSSRASPIGPPSTSSFTGSYRPGDPKYVPSSFNPETGQTEQKPSGSSGVEPRSSSSVPWNGHTEPAHGTSPLAPGGQGSSPPHSSRLYDGCNNFPTFAPRNQLGESQRTPSFVGVGQSQTGPPSTVPGHDRQKSSSFPRDSHAGMNASNTWSSHTGDSNPVPSARPHESGRTTSPFIQDVVKGLSKSASAPPPSEQSMPPVPQLILQPGVPRKVLARLTNFPRFILKADIISYFEDCKLKEEDLEFLYDDRCRPRFIHVDFDSEDSFQKALKIISAKGRLGGKFMKLEQDSHIELDEMNFMVQSLRGHGLLMENLGNDVAMEDVDRFFQGYDLGTRSVRFLQSSWLPGLKNGERRAAIVQFDSYLSASRALREKQGQFCRDRAVELRSLQ